MAARDPKLEAKSDRNDLVVAIIVGALAIGYLLFTGVNSIVSLFTSPDAITVDSPLPAQQMIAAIGSGAPATITSGTVTVDDVNAVSVVCLVLAIITGTLGLVAVAALGVIVCIRLSRGTVFDRVNARLLFALSMTLLVAGLGEVWFRNMGLNGVFAALGGEFNDQAALMMEAAPLFVAAIAAGVLVIIFRRGAALQRETEGLV